MRLKIKKTGSFKSSKKYLDLIANSKVYDVATNTPISFAANISTKLGNDVFLKREDMQPIFSFKIRGAYNKIANLTPQQKKRGVLTASAGNHAQGVANACKKLKIPCLIFMPVTTPEIKVKAVKRLGAKVKLFGDNFDQASKKALQLAKEKKIEFIEAFDDPYTIAGQGTVGKEILDADPSLDVIFVPVGGGGLLAGISAWAAQTQSKTKVYGVEVEDSACLTEALKANKRVRLREVGQFADGVAVGRVGKNNFDVIRECADGVVTVSIDELCAAVKDIFEDTRTISEPSGALSIAGMKKYLERADEPKGQRCVAVVSGANVNFDRLRHISERTEIGERREILLCVTIPEQPGSFRKFCHAIGKRAITEFNYRYADKNSAQVLVGVQTNADYADKKALLEKLGRKYSFIDLSENEVAVLHIRHMVGGRSIGLNNERLFRFEFPERPGALLRFLTGIGSRHNISMFHYRNHGSAWARVLVGVQAADDEMMSLRRELRDIGYRFWEETDNPAYRLLLS